MESREKHQKSVHFFQKWYEEAMKMYRKQPNRQLTIYDFDQPLGLTMNPENRWVKKAASIPWSVIEDK